MDLHTNITKRRMRQKNREGRVFEYDRYVLHYKDPASGKRRMRRFDTRKEAEAAQADLIRNWEKKVRQKGGVPTLQEAVDYWLASRRGTITAPAYHAYEQVARDYIVGPALRATPNQRRHHAMTGKLPINAKWAEMLGPNTRVDKITTAQIRSWYLKVLDIATPYVAKSAKKYLSSIFRLIEEDYELRLARMPSRPGPSYRRKKRLLFTDAQVRLILEEAQRDKKWGTYYAFLLLTGVRPSEMLGLLWHNVDFEKGRILIHGSQDRDGHLKEFTKTDAGMREIPMNTLLREMLQDWHTRCPRLPGKPDRVFPTQRHEKGWGQKPSPDTDQGLLVNNFRNRVWYPLLKRLGLPQVSMYATRHMAISYLQAQGVEIGLVAKIAGHSSPQVTLQYYTHAVSEYADVMDKLNTAYGVEQRTAASKTGVQP